MLDTVRAQSCYHCSAPVQPGAAFAVEVDGALQLVCCIGCRAAVQFVQEMRLDAFYAYRDKCSIDRALRRTRRAMPEEQLLEAITTDDNGKATLSLLLPDIRCAACVWLIERALLPVPGVADVNVNFGTRRLRVMFDAGTSQSEDGQADPESAMPAALSLVDILQRLGYEAKADLPEAGRQAYAASQRTLLVRLGVAGIGMMPVMMFAMASYLAGPATAANPASGMEPLFETLLRWASLALSTPVVLYSAWPFHRGAWLSLRNRSLSMDIPVSLAILAAFALSIYNTITFGAEVYFDAACMFAFFLLTGRYLELISRHHYQHDQDLLQHLLPDRAWRLSDGGTESVSPDCLKTDDLIRVEPYTNIPADGLVVEGRSSVSESAFTGEPLPLPKGPGSRVLAGSVNFDGKLLIRVSCAADQTVLAQITHLQEQAARHRPRWSQMADRAAGWFVGTVLILAAATALGWYLAGEPGYFVIALTVLVVACPCALSLATPVACTIAANALRANGIVMRSGEFLERVAGTTAVIFDKTGTLTEAALAIEQVVPLRRANPDLCLALATALERHSEHPAARAFAHGTQMAATNVEEVAGEGVAGMIDETWYRIGRPQFVFPDQPPSPPDREGLWILLADDAPLAWFCLSDRARPDAGSVVQQLREDGLHVAIFTGDGSNAGAALASALGADQLQTHMSAADKADSARTLSRLGHRLLMIGDGINDAAAMAMADTSLAVSPRDIFVQGSADATLLGGSLTTIPALLRYARRCRKVIRQNILWSMVYNFSAIPLAVAGLLPPWLAAVGMSLSSVLVVVNAGRLRRFRTEPSRAGRLTRRAFSGPSCINMPVTPAERF